MMKSLLMPICFIVMLGLGGASEYNFGTKVMPGDSDISKPLDDLFSTDNAGATVAMWDIGPNPGLYDEQDILYLVSSPIPAIMPINAVRLTPFETYSAGSKVRPVDKDYGVPLTPVPGAFPDGGSFVFLDQYGTSNSGSPRYDISDPVYWHRIGYNTDTNDVRMSSLSENYLAGTRLSSFDPDQSKPIQLVNVLQYLPSLPVSYLKYYDANGNGNYDYLDDVYLIRPVPKGPGTATQVTVNSLRLSGPAQ